MVGAKVGMPGMPLSSSTIFGDMVGAKVLESSSAGTVVGAMVGVPGVLPHSLSPLLVTSLVVVSSLLTTGAQQSEMQSHAWSGVVRAST